MSPTPKRVCRIETVWIREFARTYLPSEAGLTFAPQRLRNAGISLVGVTNVMRGGYVTSADKLDGPGAVWVIEGDNNDGENFRLTVRVITEQLDVDLRVIERVQAPLGGAKEQNDGHNAA